MILENFVSLCYNQNLKDELNLLRMYAFSLFIENLKGKVMFFNKIGSGYYNLIQTLHFLNYYLKNEWNLFFFRFCKDIACTSDSTKINHLMSIHYLTSTTSRNRNADNVQKGHYLFLFFLFLMWEVDLQLKKKRTMLRFSRHNVKIYKI